MIKFLPLLLLLVSVCTAQAQVKPALLTRKTFTNCTELTETIMLSSPRVKKLTTGLAARVKKNGGSGWGYRLEAAPYGADEESETFDYAIHETYKDRMVTIARFSVDPATGQLYEYDVVEDEKKKIAFDKTLVKYINTVCQ